MQGTPPQPVAAQPVTIKRREMTNEERMDIFVRLTLECQPGNLLPRGTISNIAREFGFSRATISRLWSLAKANMSIGIVGQKAVESKRCLCGRPKIYFAEEVIEQVMQIPLNERTTTRDLAQRLGMSHTTVHNMIQQEDSPFRLHTSSLKPVLTEAGKAASFFFVRIRLEPTGSTRTSTTRSTWMKNGFS
jgi:AraC-like DNA-binding protein